MVARKIEIVQSGMTPKEVWNKRIALMNRARPREHERLGHLRGNSFIPQTTVNAGLAIGQTGARSIKHRNKTYYQLGGGVFTRRQILESRWRYGELMTGKNISKKKVGL